MGTDESLVAKLLSVLRADRDEKIAAANREYETTAAKIQEALLGGVSASQSSLVADLLVPLGATRPMSAPQDVVSIVGGDLVGAEYFHKAEGTIPESAEYSLKDIIEIIRVQHGDKIANRVDVRTLSSWLSKRAQRGVISLVVKGGPRKPARYKRRVAALSLGVNTAE